MWNICEGETNERIFFQIIGPGRLNEKWWLGGNRQQVITWTSVDPDQYLHMATLGHNELNITPGKVDLTINQCITSLF